MSKVFVDTAPFIYLAEGQPQFRKAVHEQLSDMIKAGDDVVSSSLTLMEVLVHPKRNNDKSAVMRYKLLFKSLLAEPLIAIDDSIAEFAADIRADYNCKSVDSLQLAAALKAGCEIFYTNDISLQAVKEIHVLTVSCLEGWNAHPPTNNE